MLKVEWEIDTKWGDEYSTLLPKEIAFLPCVGDIVHRFDGVLYRVIERTFAPVFDASLDDGGEWDINGSFRLKLKVEHVKE